MRQPPEKLETGFQFLPKTQAEQQRSARERTV
jgi:hypothetical protein